MRFGIVENKLCNDWQAIDTTYHAALECTNHENQQDYLRQTAVKLELQWPSTIASLVNYPETYHQLHSSWQIIKSLRNT